MESDNIFKNGVFIRSTVFNVLVSAVTFLIGIQLPRENYIFFYEYFIGTIVTYVNDIVFVQKYFTNDKGMLSKITYSDIWYRIRYTLDLYRMSKFALTFTIQLIMIHKMEAFVMYHLKEKNWLQSPPKHLYNNGTNFEQYRSHLSIIIKVIIKFILDIIIFNFIKFKWVYVNSPNAMFTLVISTFFVLILMIASN